MRPVLRWLRERYPTPAAQKHVVEDYHRLKDVLKGPLFEDLRNFCYVYDTTEDERGERFEHRKEGRRQVYLHIVNMMETSTDEISEAARRGARDTRDDARGPIDDD